MGTIVAHDKKAAAKWRNAARRPVGNQRGLTGAALEGAVMNIAQMFPGNVIHGTA